MHRAAESVVIDGSGQGKVEISPGPAFEGWFVTQLASIIDGVTDPTGELKVYRNQIVAGEFVGGTHDPAADTSPEDFVLTSHDKLVFVWSDVSPTGGTATGIVTYELQAPR